MILAVEPPSIGHDAAGAGDTPANDALAADLGRGYLSAADITKIISLAWNARVSFLSRQAVTPEN